jgi:hypothetical protein
LRISSQSRHSERMVRTKRSAIAFRLWRADRCLDDPNAFAAEDPVEGAAVLAVAVANQEADAALAEVETEVAGVLGHPLAGRIPRATGEPDATARVLDEEEHVQAAEQDRLDREEVAGDDAGRLRPQELAPAGAGPTRRRLQARPTEQAADAGRRRSEAELCQFPADPAVAPARVLARKPQHQLPNLRRQRRTTNPRGRLTPLPTHERPMPAQQRPRGHQQ